VADSRRFAKGSAVYVCDACGKKTRATGRGDNENVNLCAKCYDMMSKDIEIEDRK
jgi:hypothetical protein